MFPTTNAQPPTPERPLALLVENDEDTRQMYAEWLIFSGFRVAEAETAEEAIEKTHQLRPHIIATDLGLTGGSDGCDLCVRLKTDARTKDIPIIAVTAWAMGGFIERAWSAGCDSVLMKPCSPEQLLAEIQRLLNRPAPRIETLESR